MAESTTTPTRRLALQDISTNVSLVHSASPFGPRRAGGGGAGAAGTTKAAGGAAQSRLLGADTGAGEPRAGAPRRAFRGEAQLGGAKRVFDLVYSNHEGEGAGVGGRDGSPEVDGGEGGGAKRTRVETLGEGADDDVLSVRGMQSEDVGFPVSVHEEDTSSSALSPPSSLVCSNNWLNDSQSTVVTEPDDPRAGVMRGEELRLKARTLKLRLRLAKYKVQTNQIDTPMSQLKIKNTSESPELSTVPILAHTPRHRPLSSSSRTSNTHSVSNREQNQGKKQSLSSSPPPYPEAASHDESSLESREAISTPLLPRQRQGLLNPPSLGGDFEDRSPARELTSSVVKGRAANGLLSLMAHQG